MMNWQRLFYGKIILFLAEQGLSGTVIGSSVLQGIIYHIHTESGIDEITVLTELVIAPAGSDRLTELLVFFTAPCFLQWCFGQICQRSNFEVITTADSHAAVRENKHIRIGH